jgi:dTDP-4-amino-4,6-dideoxygalactose transaminase
MIRLAAPDLDEHDFAAVADVLRTGFLVQGREVEAFELRIRELTGTAHAIAVSSCTAALHLGLLALQIAPGDLVAVTAYSWPASANVIALSGAMPVFVDIDARTFNMDPGSLDRAMRVARGIRAIMPVHAFGGMAAMAEIKAIASRYEVPIIEDAACAMGAVFGGRAAGTWGDVGCYSFHPRKLVTTGEGGVVITESPDIAARIRSLRNHGQAPNAPRADFVLPGFNYRLTEFQAALGRTQLGKLERIIAVRRQLARQYDAWLSESGVVTPASLEGSAHTYQSYVLLLPLSAPGQRDRVMTLLKQRGIETSIGTHHLPLTTYWRRELGCKEGDFPVTDDVAARALTLPLHTALSTEDQRTVVEELKAALHEVRSAGGARG